MFCKAPNGKCIAQEACELGGACVYAEPVGYVEPYCWECKGLLTEIEVDGEGEVYCRACDVSTEFHEPGPPFCWMPCKVCKAIYLSCGFPGLTCPTCLDTIGKAEVFLDLDDPE